MAFICELITGQRVYLENQGEQTRLLVSLSRPGQQQQSSSSFQTGAWSALPLAFSTGSGLLLKITAHQSDAYIQVQGNRITLMLGSPDTAGYHPIALQDGELPSNMKMGTVDEHPHSHTYSHHSTRSYSTTGSRASVSHHVSIHNCDTSFESIPSATIGQFCQRCGGLVEEGDRFCRACGNPLQS